jgi:DNA-binding transcriptional regulator YhcF (GntR family)
MSRKKPAPYAKIVAELRSRIERGTLAPGDRIPSTREIVRRWGVAMATATKVLTTLRQEGLVRTVPGVGSTVSGERRTRARTAPTSTRALAAANTAQSQPPSRRGAPEALARERITAAALTIADAEGLIGLSMRRIAVELGVATMSLYRHIAGRDELLLQMMDAACRELPFPSEPPDGWRARLELAAHMLWTTFRRHPWLAPAMSVTRPQLILSGLAYTEWVLATLDQHGLDAATAITSHITLFNYIRGTAVNLELEAEAEATSGLSGDQWLNSQESELRAILADGRFPVFARLLTTPYDFDLEVLFEFGLQRLLDGLAPLIEARPPAV